MEEIKDMELLLIGLLLSNYMLIKNQHNNLKKFSIVFLFSNIVWSPPLLFFLLYLVAYTAFSFAIAFALHPDIVS